MNVMLLFTVTIFELEVLDVKVALVIAVANGVIS
jgi:hypothetical protein